MKFNFPATRQKMKLLNVSKWARHYGFNESTVRRILTDGDYPPSGETFTAIVEQLRADGYLVEGPEDEAAA